MAGLSEAVDIADRYVEAVAEHHRTGSLVDELRDELFAAMDEVQRDDLVASSGMRVQRVMPRRLVIDDAMLSELVDEGTWSRVTKRSVDRKAMEQAVADGDIDTQIVDKVTSFRDSSPYLRIREPKEPRATSEPETSN